MLTRLTAFRTLPRLAVVPARFKSSTVEGSVAQDKGFSKKEKAHEDEYVHRHEMELLTKMKNEIEKKKEQLEKLQQKQQELEKNLK